MVFAMGGLVILIIFGHSVHLSLIIMRSQELAMQVSLLNQENEETLRELVKLEARVRQLEADRSAKEEA